METELARIIPQSEKMSLPQMKKLMPENEKMLADPVLLKKWAAAMMNLSMLTDCLQTHFHLPEREPEPSSK